jgi:hypothetical protein
METGMGRRVFVGSVLAGLPLLASSNVRTAAQSGTAAMHIHPEGTAADAVLEHICRQLASLHNAIRKQPRGEHVRAVAAQLRTLAVYGRQQNVDASVRSAVNTLVEQEGREHVLYLEPNRERMRAELKRFGAEPDERLLGLPSQLDYSTRNAVLNDLQRSGLTARWERLAAIFERGGPGVDKRGETVVRVRQDDADWWQGFCTQLLSEYQESQLLTGAICATALLPIPIFQVAASLLCVAQQLAALISLVVYAGFCLNSGLFALII